MEELIDLRRKTEEARRRYGGRPSKAPDTVAAVGRSLLGGRRADLALPPKPAGIPELTHEEVLRSREELARRFAPPPQLRPPAVPPRYQHARFSKWERKVPGIETAREAVQLWVAGVAAGKHLMVALVGPQGTSKSHLLACATWELFERHRIRAGFFEWFLVADKMRDIETAARMRQELYDARPLILDECRPTSNTDFDAIELAKVAMHAYSHQQSVLLATNWASLDELMGGPAADRFTVVPVIGPSAR